MMPVRPEFTGGYYCRNIGIVQRQATGDKRTRKGEKGVRIIDAILLIAFLVAIPIVLATAAYAFMWVGLCLVRFIPLIGRKHRHPDWDRLNT
jgi:hypothetical protein